METLLEDLSAQFLSGSLTFGVKSDSSQRLLFTPDAFCRFFFSFLFLQD